MIFTTFGNLSDLMKTFTLNCLFASCIPLNEITNMQNWFPLHDIAEILLKLALNTNQSIVIGL